MLRAFIVHGYMLTAVLCSLPALGQDVLTQRNDAQRSGANVNESQLTPQKLKEGKFGKLCFRVVDGNPYAQPLYASQVAIDGQATKNVVIVATEHNSVYAFDADDVAQDSASAQLWHATLGGTPVASEVLSKDLGLCEGCCVDLTTEIGITATPVISQDKKLVYVVAKSLDGPGHKYAQTLHVLKLSDGRPATMPVTIEGEVTGNGKGSAGGKIKFDPMIQLNRPGLLLVDNVLYIAFGGHCDQKDFHGWLFAYDVSDADNIKKLDVFCTTPTETGADDGEGGIWQSGQGPAADANGNVYFSTGDGSANRTTDFGDSVVKLKLESGKLTVKDWYTPQNEQTLKEGDVDLGSAGPVLLPDSPSNGAMHLLLAGGKEGRLYLIDRDDMGKGVKLSRRSFQVTNGPFPKDKPKIYWNIHGSPVIWKRSDHLFTYVCGEEDKIKQYKIFADAQAGWRFDGQGGEDLMPLRISRESAPYPNFPAGKFKETTREPVFMPGGLISLSADGDKDGTGILWVSMPLAADANHRVVPGILRAYDAEDVTVEIWDSEGDPKDGVGMFAKFCPPTIANGKVFLATFQDEELSGGNEHPIHHIKPNGKKPAIAIYGLKP